MLQNDTLRNLLVASAIFMTVYFIGSSLLSRIGPPPQEAGAPPPADGEAPPAGIPQQQTAGVESAPGATATPGAASPQSGLRAEEAQSEETISIGAAEVTEELPKDYEDAYRMGLTLSNLGASIESAIMSDHKQELEKPDRYRLLQPIDLADGRRLRSLAIEKILVDGETLTLHDKKWHTEGPKETAEGVEAEYTLRIHKDDEAVLLLTRRFSLPRQPRSDGRHDLETSLSVESLVDRDQTFSVTYRGGFGIERANYRVPDRYVDWGTRNGGGVSGQRKNVTDAAKNRGVLNLYRAPRSPEEPLLSWAATANTYFTCTLTPLNPADNTHGAKNIQSVDLIDFDQDLTTNEDVTLVFATKATSLPPRGRLSFPVEVYLGQKERVAFKTIDKYVERNFYYQISKGFGMCTFTALVEMMLWLLDALYSVIPNYGIAIIILVLIVRTLLHPITKKGQVNMVRMQQQMGEFQPKVNEIKKKYANDKQRLNQETMKLYREQGVNPAGQFLTCMPMLLQMPIWVALWVSLSSNIGMRHQPFFFWIQDLASQDALYTFSSPVHVPLFGWELPSFNLLPILLCITMYLQQKLMPKPKPNPSVSDEQRAQQESMQKMMPPMMCIMMLLIFYKAPSGLNLYIMCSSLFGAIEQWWIRKHIAAHEEAGTLHKPAKKRKRPGWLDNLSKQWKKAQTMADDAQRAQKTGGGKARRRKPNPRTGD